MAAGGVQIRCRGLRKWCDRRCDVTTPVPPPGYPTVGFYCALHKYQEATVSMDGSIKFGSEAIESHVKRRTSFVAPEASVALELSRAPGVVRDRPDVGKSAAGIDVVMWLKDRRGFDDASAAAYAQRMVDAGMLVPTRKEYTKKFSTEKNAIYTVVVAGGARA